ncbi:MAG: NAD(P)-dependent oxidoreductase, partial [Rhizobiaceae bacterium]|nr:NAD(P)-dependent oxidoreductase [Rhizobiaceae bacterium]
MSTIALIGFGEAGQAFAAGWKTVASAWDSLRVSTFDVKSRDDLLRPSLLDACNRFGVRNAESPWEALRGSDVVFSLVTADRALEVAISVASAIEPGSLYLDCNSCAPSNKEAAAKIIEEAGGRYVDVAVMAPVHPARHRTPLLIAGSHAGKALGILEDLGMNAQIAGDRIGQASSIKMLRSV